MTKKTKTYVARDPRALGQTVVLWLYIRLASTAFNIVANVIQLRGLSRVPPDAPVSMSETLPGLETADLISGLSGLMLLATMLVSGFLTLKWIYRVTMNSHTLASGVRVSPPWAIGWYFVPFANLYKPFQALHDAWAVSLSPQSWRTQDTPAVLRWWWGLWLATSMLDNASFRLQLRTHDAATALFGAGVDLVSDILWIALCLVLIRIVRRLSARQADTLSTTAFD
jgi:hypothetical protein